MRTMQGRPDRRAKSRGLTMIELMIGMIVLAAIAGGALGVYFTQIRPKQYRDEKVDNFRNLVGALEDIRSSYNNAYPAGTVSDLGTLPPNATTTLQRLLASRIGSNNAKYRGWGYNCVAATGNLQITVNVGDTSDANQRFAIYNSISESYKGEWSCTSGYDGSAATFTCSAVVTCR